MSVEAPCSWPWIECACADFDDVWPDQDDDIVALASYLLWAATGKVYGPCPTSVLPCVTSTCGYCENPLRQCSCRHVPEIRLDGPVAEITEVVIDGVPLPDTDYRVDDYEWLVRLDGESWPTDADPLDPDGFRVDYLLGVSPPAGAGAATGELACEIAKARCNHEACRLPSNIRSLTRQGISVEFTPGGFGLFVVDKWIESAKAPILAGAVHSPDIPHHRKITWQASTSP
jgi:hypothetical protein